MTLPVEVDKIPEVWAIPASKQFDETVWQRWVEKCAARDLRNSAVRLMAVKWASLVTLVVVAGLWSLLGPYDVVARFIVAAGAIFIMFDAIHSGHPALAVVFAAIALLYNWLVPVFSFSGDWPRALVLASAVPFVASLTAPTVTKDPDV